MKKLFILLSLSVTGCSTYDGSFECPVGSGMACASLSKINKSMDQGLINNERDLSDQEATKTPAVYIAPFLSQKLKG
ncbi:MAG: hypothetical protein F9K49_01345 [Caedimonadaceae bacterium]|nr:MAG: hypothetical protein F9K49_01345 [Caedimonadaceae bacterium]